MLLSTTCCYLSSKTRIIFSCNFNIFLDCSLDTKANSPSLQKHSLSKLIEIKQKIDLCDIWRVKKLKTDAIYF